MIICPQCGRENEDTFKYCLGCGLQLPKPVPAVQASPAQPQIIPCPHCGTPVPSNFKFCGACGNPIPQAAAAEVAAPPGSGSSGSFGAQPRSPQLTPDPQPSYARSESTAQLARNGIDGQLISGPIVQPGPGTAVAKLVVIRPDGTEGATIPLRDGRVTIGRESEHQVLAADPFLSPSHASITAGASGFTISDEDSLNGIFYRIRGEVELAHGDLIRMGQELLLFELMSQVEPIIAARMGDEETQRGGSPDKGLWGRLSLISGPEVVTRGFAFSEDEITIGREIGDILFRDDGFVSGRHARISKLGDRIMLKDLGSSNGTYVRIRGTRQLQDGDLVLMGQQLFRLVG